MTALATLKLDLVEAEGEPRVRDLDLGRALGFDRPRKVRELIQRYLPELERFGPTPQRGAMVAVGSGAKRPVSEFWLNEKQAVFLISKSDTAVATDILVQVVEVFHAWRHGHLGAAQSAGGLTAAEHELLKRTNGMSQALMAKVTALEKAVVTIAGRDPSAPLEPGLEVSTAYVPAIQVLVDAKVPPKGRRPLVGRASAGMSDLSQRKELPYRREPYGCRRKLFHVDVARAWLAVEGAALIAEHNARRPGGQGVLPFKPRSA